MTHQIDYSSLNSKNFPDAFIPSVSDADVVEIEAIIAAHKEALENKNYKLSDKELTIYAKYKVREDTHLLLERLADKIRETDSRFSTLYRGPNGECLVFIYRINPY